MNGNVTSTGNSTFNNITAGNISIANGTLNLTNTTVIGFNGNNLSQITGDLGVNGNKTTYASNGVTGNLTTKGVTGTKDDPTIGTLTYNIGAITTYTGVNGTQTVAANTTIGNRLAGVQYQNLVNGNELVDGNLYVNGNITATNSNVTNLISTNLTATTLNVSGQSIMSGINNSGALNNVGNLTNVGNTTLTGLSNIISTPGGGSLTTNVTGATLTGNQNVQGLALNNNGSIALKGTNAAGLTVNAAGTGVTLLNNVNGGHGLNIGATSTTLSGGTNSSSLALNNNNAVLSVGTATTAEVNVINAINTNGNTSFISTANGNTGPVASSVLTSIYSADGTAIQGTVGNISSVTGTPGVGGSQSVSSVLLTNGRGITNGLQVFEDHNNLNGTTIINGVLNVSNATVIGLNIDPGSLAADRILGDPAAPLSSNGVNGVNVTTGTNDVVNGTGGVITYKNGLIKTVAANTTIGNRLAGVKYQTQVAGNQFIDGNLYVNGDTAFVGTNSATSTVDASKNLASSKLAGATTGVIGQTGITVYAPVTDIVKGTTATEAVASTTLTNGLGKTNGLQVFEDRTNLTGGGQTPSSLTLNNNGATFATSTGAPAKVTGIADGTTKYDAVNFGQLQALSNNMDGIAAKAYSGIAQSAAMNSIPTGMAGHHYGIGIGSGFYAGQQAIAFGGGADVGEHIKVKAAVANGFGTSSAMTANVGAGFSW